MTPQSGPVGMGPVGMVGVGNMGGRMTRRMVDAGYDVLAFDADPSRIPARRPRDPDRVPGVQRSWLRRRDQQPVVDAFGDLAGGVRVSEQQSRDQQKQEG